jgi:hypothetical protein
MSFKAANGKRLVSDGLKPPGVAVSDIGGEILVYAMDSPEWQPNTVALYKLAVIRLPALFRQRR